MPEDTFSHGVAHYSPYLPYILGQTCQGKSVDPDQMLLNVSTLFAFLSVLRVKMVPTFMK